MKTYTKRAIEMASNVLNLSKRCIQVAFEAKEFLLSKWSYVLLEHPESQTYILIWGETNKNINLANITTYQNIDDAYKALINAIKN